MTYRDVGYRRLSHPDPDEAGALARQGEDIERVSTATGGHIVAMLTDNAISASRYARRKRKDYPRIAELARAGSVDRAVIYDLDRLLRIPRELEDLIDLVEELGGRFSVVGVNGVMDLATADGRFFARMRVAQAAKESDDLSRRIRRQIVQGAEQGRPRSSGKSRPFGFSPDGVTHDPAEAALIRAAAEDVLYRAVPLNEVARRWNRAGHRTARRGTLWSNRTVREVLTGARAAGLRVHHKGRDDQQTFPAQWDPIIDAPTHSALVRLLVTNGAHRPGRRTEHTGLFVAVVDSVAHPMRRDRNRSIPVYRTYPRFPGQSPPRLQVGPADQLETLVREWLFLRVESGALAATIARRRAERATPPVESPADVQTLIDQAAVDEATGVMDRRDWLTKRKVLVARLRAAEAAESTVVDPAERVPVDIRQRWPGWDIDHRAAALRAVIDRVEIAPATRRGPGLDPDRLTPIWR